MICDSCKNETCVSCLSPNCCCGHVGSPVRALTSIERQRFQLGLTEHATAMRPVIEEMKTTTNGFLVVFEDRD